MITNPGSPAESPAFEADTRAAAAFRTLRELVNNWLVDATERRNPYADALLGQLRRWLLSAFSSMREPALRHLVELCMKECSRCCSPR